MKFEEILKACSSGKLPKVLSSCPIKYAQSAKGTVTTIKANGKHSGVGVTFEGLDYELWFHDSDDTDKRTRYLRDLTLIK